MEREGRLVWLDALRGFTMVMVVAYHVAQMSFGESERISASLPFLVLFRMPTFFFVSGFLAYKATARWTCASVWRLSWKKIKVQMLPTLVFLCVFLVLRKPHFWDALLACLRSPTKGGYWFTWVLLQMFLVYYLWSWLTRGKGWCVWLLWLLSLLAYETLYVPRVFTYWHRPFYSSSSLIETIKFLQFFLLGNLARRHWDTLLGLFQTRWFFPLCAVVGFLCCADYFRWHCLRLVWTNLPRTLAMYCLLLVLVQCFVHYESLLTPSRPLGRALQFIGQRTLDIYLLHYLFLPRLPEVGAWLNRCHPNFVLDVTLSVGLGLLVIAFCLLVSAVLRTSPF
ncbi:MAG: acyltransferase, partial [Prevotellaceae bacterium]|nr:acyltransferase [Prevotellaceae bacterium]